MKAQYLLAGAAALALATSTYADVTVDITGATAFRVAALETIKAQFVASGQPFKFAHDRTAGGFNGSTRAIFVGTFPGVPGTTTIRTSFNGSVEGISALVESPAKDPTYLLPSVLGSTTAAVGGAELANISSPVAAAQSEIAFSDVSITSTPLVGNLQPADPAAGVVVFTMIASESAPASLTNVTSQQFRALFGAGLQPLSLFTGLQADGAITAVAVGRNDGSGTRTTYLAETGYGISNPVQQYVVTASDASQITQVRRTRQHDGGTAANPGPNASIIWGQDVDGNGGYSSGSNLRTDMGKTSAGTTILDADGSDLYGGPVPVTLISWLSTGDAVPARQAGAKILGYNGVTLESLKTQTTLDAADRAKVTNGQYTAWSYQQMYRRGDITSGDVVTVYNGIKNGFTAATLGATGIPISEMNVGREVDGGVVAP